MALSWLQLWSVGEVGKEQRFQAVSGTGKFGDEEVFRECPVPAHEKMLRFRRSFPVEFNPEPVGAEPELHAADSGERQQPRKRFPADWAVGEKFMEFQRPPARLRRNRNPRRKKIELIGKIPVQMKTAEFGIVVDGEDRGGLPPDRGEFPQLVRPGFDRLQSGIVDDGFSYRKSHRAGSETEFRIEVEHAKRKIGVPE